LRLHSDALTARSGVANLLSGEFRRLAPPLIRWSEARRPAAIAAGLAVALLSVAAADGFRSVRAIDRYDAAAKKVHAAAFPGSGASDIKDHARKTLESGRSSSGFIDMSSRLSTAVASVDAAAIDRIRYDRERREFRFNVRATTDADIEKLRAALAAQGINAADQGGYRKSGEVWVGEMSAGGQ
jgi:type II secretion system protein L